MTRADGKAFLALAPQILVSTDVQTFPLEAACDALKRLRDGAIRDAAVFVVDDN